METEDGRTDASEFPKGLGLKKWSLHNWALIVDLVNEVAPTDVPTIQNNQPLETVNSIIGIPDTRLCENHYLPGYGDMSYHSGPIVSYANSKPLRLGECAAFRPFKRLPPQLRSKVWNLAAQAARAGSPTVFNFTFKKMPLIAGTRYRQLSSGLFHHAHLVHPADQLVRDIRELMRHSHDGDAVLTLSPSAALANATQGIRDVLRCHPDARAELKRHPSFTSCFNFHWIDGCGCVNLGTIRPFCYDADWISLDGLDYTDYQGELGFGRPGVPGVRCTPDLGRIQHFAFPYRRAPEDDFVAEQSTQMGVLYWLDSLRSVGFYRPSFAIEAAMVTHFDAVITKSQRLFLKGVSAPSPWGPSEPELNDNFFRTAMLRLERLIRVIRNIGQNERWLEQQQEGKRSAFAALKFCFLIHADSQGALDLMKFREGGSHLDEVRLNWLDDPECFGGMIRGMSHLVGEQMIGHETRIRCCLVVALERVLHEDDPGRCPIGRRGVLQGDKPLRDIPRESVQ